MFKNFKVIMHMSSPIAVMDNIILDSIISAAACKEILGDDYYAGANETGTKELQDSILSKILDKQYDVYCTSYGLGDNKEFVGTWSKKFDTKNDYLIKHEGKGKNRLDIGAGHYKNYHMPIILKSYKEIVFYVRGDLEKIQELAQEDIIICDNIQQCVQDADIICTMVGYPKDVESVYEQVFQYAMWI